MKRTLLFIVVIVLSSALSYSQSLPAGIAVWLRADSAKVSGGLIDSITDLSGNNHYAFSTGVQRPQQVLNVLNGKPAIRFDGVDDRLTGVTIPGINDSSLTVFAVASGSSMTNAERGIFSINSSTNGFWFERGTSTQSLVMWNNNQFLRQPNTLLNSGFNFKLLSCRKTKGVVSELFSNSALLGSGTNASLNASFTNTNYVIGRTVSSWIGDIAEILVYSRALTNLEMQAVENYLYGRYAPPPVNLGSDINQQSSLCSVTLNAGSNFSNYLWSTGATSPSISVGQTGTYSVTVTDIFGRISSDTINIVFPDFSLTLTDTIVCPGSSVPVSTLLQSPGNFYFTWNTGLNTSSVVVNNQGSYWVTVTDTSSPGCFGVSDTLAVVFDTFSSTTTLGNDTSLCSGNKIGLKNPSSGWSALSFIWSDGTNGSLVTVQNSGVYSVTVSNNIGCVATDSINVTVGGITPSVSFEGDTICLGQSYNPQSSITSVDPIDTLEWNFGNQSISNSPTPNHLYLQEGMYNVTLRVTTNAGCSNSYSDTVIVQPVPAANFSTDTACIFNPYQFTDLSTAPAGGSISQWQWNFGDNSPLSYVQNPQHQYTSASIYAVSLTVAGTNGCSSILSKPLTVVSATSQPLSFSTIAPANYSLLYSPKVTFSWNSSANSDKYSLIISTDSLYASASVFNNINTTSHVANLQNNTTYFWKVIAYNVCNDSSVSASNRFTIFLIESIPSLSLWLKADSGIVLNGGFVSQWSDVSGNGYHAIQTTASQRPFISGVNNHFINNQPALSFDGNDDRLNGSVINGIGDSSITIFVVARGDSMSPAERGMFSINSSANGFWFERGTSTQSLAIWNNNQVLRQPNTLLNSGFNYKLLGCRKTKGVLSELFSNSVLLGTGNNAALNGPFVNTNYVVGRTVSSWIGSIAEIIVYSKSLSNSEMQVVEGYLYNKYAPPVNLGSDIVQPYSLCPIVLDASNRFISYTWSTGESTQTIQAKASGTYWVEVEDVFGRKSSDTIKVTTSYKGTNFNDTTICNYSSVTVTPILTSAPYSFLWNTQQTTNSITVNSNGGFVCIISDTVGCSFVTDTVSVSIDNFSLVDMLPSDTNICSNNSMSLDLAGYTPQSIHWNDNSSNTFNIISTQGNYSVTVTNTNACVAVDTAFVHVKSTAPNVNFSAPNVCFGATTQFTDITAQVPGDPIKTWYWNFGGSGTSSAQNPSLVFFAPGDYNVTLSIVTDSGCTGEMTKVVTAALPPVPAFNYPSIVCAGTPVTLTDQTVFLFGDSIANWIWTFNGGDTITSKNAVYEFPTQGSYTVKLTAISKSGCSDTVEQVVDVFPPLTANFDASGLCIGDSTVFTDITSSLSIVSWQWGFGDFSLPSTKQNPKHKYNTPGSYSVTLTVENAIGCVDNISKTVNIVTRPTAKFGQLVTCEDQTYTPLDSSIANNDTISIWKWNIAGTNYTGSSPVHYFSDTGNYSIKLRVSTQSGCSDSTVKVVSVKPRPKAQFSYTPLYGEAPVDVSFVNQSTNSSTYFWSFGDGDVSTDFAPYHTYITNDTFDIQLTAISAFGCEDSTRSTFLVAPTDLDIAVLQVNTLKDKQADGSYLITAGAKVANLGTRIITNAQFYVTIGSGGVISEEWSGLLNPGAVADIVFTAQFVVAAENANSYVCVTAVNVNNSETEISTANNSQCSTTSEGIQLIGPSPNPMSSQAQLGIILPKAGQVVIDIADMAGQYVVQGLQLDLPKGRSNYTLPADKMRAAEYFIRVYHNDEKLVRKFIVAK